MPTSDRHLLLTAMSFAVVSSLSSILTLEQSVTTDSYRRQS
jgi:hypothetical protein